MAEYINKDDILPYLNKKTYAYRLVKIFPISDVAPVKHGKWIMKGFHKGVCNQCHRLDDIDPLATHCRYCGAKMDLKE